MQQRPNGWTNIRSEIPTTASLRNMGEEDVAAVEWVCNLWSKLTFAQSSLLVGILGIIATWKGTKQRLRWSDRRKQKDRFATEFVALVDIYAQRMAAIALGTLCPKEQAETEAWSQGARGDLLSSAEHWARHWCRDPSETPLRTAKLVAVAETGRFQGGPEAPPEPARAARIHERAAAVRKSIRKQR